MRFIRRLADMMNVNGILVLESSLTRNRHLIDHNCVEILWPKSQLCLRVGEDDDTLIDSVVTVSPDQSMSIRSNISHMPSRKAVLSWLEMAGFQNFQEVDLGFKNDERMGVLVTRTDFPGYTYSNRGPKPSPYFIGGAE